MVFFWVLQTDGVFPSIVEEINEKYLSLDWARFNVRAQFTDALKHDVKRTF